MTDYQPIDYRLRCHTKRTDLPADILQDIGEAYAEIERLEQRKAKILAELDAARREVCSNQAMLRMQRHYVHRESEEVVLKAKEISVEYGWDCFNTPKPKVDKTLKGVIIDGGKAVPPKYEDLDNG